MSRFYEAYEREDGKLPVPLIAGLLPLASARHAAFLQQEVPGIDIPARCTNRCLKAVIRAQRPAIN